MAELDNPTINKIINYIITELRSETRKYIEVQLIIKRFGIDKKNVNFLIEKLKNNLKLNYDPQNKLFFLKKNIINNKEQKRNILTKEDFLKVLEDIPEGILEDQNLYDCYKQIKQDIDQMKKLQAIRYVTTEKQEKQQDKQEKVVLFPRNAEFDLSQEGKTIEIPEILKTEWKKIIDNTEKKHEKVVLQIDMNDSKKRRKQRKKQFFGRIYNKWMRDQIDFSEVEKAQFEEIKESYELQKKKKLEQAYDAPIAAILTQKAHNKIERFQNMDHLFHEHKVLIDNKKK